MNLQDISQTLFHQPTPVSGYFNGVEWVQTGSSSFGVESPTNRTRLYGVYDCTLSEFERAVEFASVTMAGADTPSPEDRSAILRNAHSILLKRKEALGHLMHLEQGKPLKAAFGEIDYASDFLKVYASDQGALSEVRYPGSDRDHEFRVQLRPVGVVAAITPWNYPVSMITRKVAPAFAAGCAVVLKPSELTPMTAAAVVQVLTDAGLPQGWLSLTPTSDAKMFGRFVVDSPRVAKLTFTGSTEVGRNLASQAAYRMKRISMELGGNAPYIIFPDLDLERAVRQLRALRLLNSGQACISPNRVLVHEDIYEEFLRMLSEEVESFISNSADDVDQTTIAPLINAEAVQKVAALVSEAIASGGRLLTGGVPPESMSDTGYYYPPTVVADVDSKMRIWQEEIFGPVFSVRKFSSDDEALSLAIDTETRLAAFVMTGNSERLETFASQLPFGVIGLNDLNPTAAQVPFGGIGLSGIGREGGLQGLSEYVESVTIGVR